MSKEHNSRAITAQILFHIIEKGQNLNQQLASHNHNAYVQELCYGVCRYYPELIFYVQKLLRQPLKAKNKLVELLLCIGLYELQYSHTAPYAVVNEICNAAKMLQQKWAVALLNASLRNFIRQREKLNTEVQQDITAKFAHWKWFIEKIKGSYPQQWQEILIANNQRPPLHLRINLSKINRATYLEKCATLNINATPADKVASGVCFTNPIQVTDIPGFNTGECSVQDFSAQYAASLLKLAPDLRVLDACAAPGGKTTHILETENLLKEVVAIDHDSQRCQKITENLQRLNLTANVICLDANQAHTRWPNHYFDRILLDSPCSATGVIRRHPDIKLTRTAKDIAQFAVQQKQLLKSLWPLLNVGGILLYVTCSILPDENELIIKEFLSEQKDAQEAVIHEEIGLPRQFGRQIITGNANMDGFYYARLQKLV